MPTLADAKRTEAERLVAPYRSVYDRLVTEHPEHVAALAPPDAVATALAENLARHKSPTTGRHYFRFKRTRPPVDAPHGAYTFRVLYEHARPDGYLLPIDFLMLARWYAPKSDDLPTFEQWEATLATMAIIARSTPQES